MKRKMRCDLHVFLLFVFFTFLSVLYVLSQIASTSLVVGEDRGPSQEAIPEKSSHDAASVLRKSPGLAGLCDREGFDR